MIIALASPRFATCLDEALDTVERLVAEAASQRAEIVCFPEAYLPGLRGLGFDVLPFDVADQGRVLATVARIAKKHRVATILGMERLTGAGRENVAAVLDANGELLGFQAKNQLAPSEDPFYVPGTGRQIFEVNGVKFGIAICHEGWRYPETVRWAAVRGAKIVFHPQHTGSDQTGTCPTQWGAIDGPYYEKAMMCRGLENTIWFASVNYALTFPESATSIIDPQGQCRTYLPYGREGVLVREIDIDEATGLLAGRFAPARYVES